MELVQELVRKAMAALSNDLMDSLMARLEVIGVNSVDDLNFVTMEDVEGILPPIQCRRLIQAFSAGKLFFIIISNPHPSELFCLNNLSSVPHTLIILGYIGSNFPHTTSQQEGCGFKSRMCNMSGLVPGPFCVEFACSPRVHPGSPHRTP